jgi:hypothetical protein
LQGRILTNIHKHLVHTISHPKTSGAAFEMSRVSPVMGYVIPLWSPRKREEKLSFILGSASGDCKLDGQKASYRGKSIKDSFAVHVFYVHRDLHRN